MRSGWRIGELGGVEIRVDPSLTFIAFFVTFSLAARVLPISAPGASASAYWLAGLLAAALFIGSILWHEMAHALMAIRYRIPVVQIVLHLFGGVAQIARDPERPRQEFEIAIAGPLSSLFLAVGFGMLASLDSVVGAMCGWLSMINLTLAVFNMLPGFPLDGGRVLRAILWHFGGSYRKSTRQAARVGQGMAGLFALLAALELLRGFLFNAVWFLLIAGFLYSVASAAYRSAPGGLTKEAAVRRVMRYNVPIVDPKLPLALLAWRYMDHARDQAFPVMKDGYLLGMVTAVEADRIPRLEWGKIRVEDVMIPAANLPLVYADEPLESALEKLDKSGLDHGPVYDGATLLGMINRRDIVYRT
ncbi:MAG: site-2 protease family protein [Anaerolineae bacterium]